MPQEGEQVQQGGQEPTGEQGGQKGGQEPQTFDADYVGKLRGEAAGYRTKASDLEKQLKQYEDRDKSEQQKLEEKATTAETRAADAEARLLRFEVAAAKELPSKWAARLRGSTREELEADAEELLKEIQPAATSFDGGTRPSGSTQPTDMDAAIRRAAGRA